MNSYSQSEDGSEYINSEDFLSGDNDTDALFECVYSRRVPIISITTPLTDTTDNTRIASSKSDIRHNTRRHSLNQDI